MRQIPRRASRDSCRLFFPHPNVSHWKLCCFLPEGSRLAGTEHACNGEDKAHTWWQLLTVWPAVIPTYSNTIAAYWQLYTSNCLAHHKESAVRYRSMAPDLDVGTDKCWLWFALDISLYCPSAKDCPISAQIQYSSLLCRCACEVIFGLAGKQHECGDHEGSEAKSHQNRLSLSSVPSTQNQRPVSSEDGAVYWVQTMPTSTASSAFAGWSFAGTTWYDINMVPEKGGRKPASM